MSSTPTSERQVSAAVGGNAACEQFLAALFADAPKAAYIELRFRTGERMARAFYETDHIGAASRAITRHAPLSDVYIGVLPRVRRSGTRNDVVPRASVLWVDCDTPESAVALAEFVPTPSITLASGSGANRHAYWLLRDAFSVDTIETANRRLAWLLGADTRCSDGARILRPPSVNHKHDPPSPARLLHCNATFRHGLEDVVGLIPDEPGIARHRPPASDQPRADPLLNLDPAEYVNRLTGLNVGRNGKVSCPFHEDRTPSLHVYRDPRRGWHCYGCGRGGSVYDLAALLWLSGQSSNAPLRGPQFIEVRQRLLAMFFDDSAAA